jgi:3-mercaptopyruvate sulfurtransferase SseA
MGNDKQTASSTGRKRPMIKEWIWAGSIHLVLGFVLGWIVFARPQWATDLIAKLRAKIEEVISNAKRKSSLRAVIVDTRDTASYEGKAAGTGLGTAAKSGHIASAKTVPTASILNADGTFKSAAEIMAAYTAVGVTKDTKVILYCGTGLLASASWFALTQILGNNNVKNYDGSWFEFAATAPEAVIETPSSK